MSEAKLDMEVEERLEKVETQAYDNEQHLGKKVKIERAKTYVTDRFKDKQGNPTKSYYLKVETEILDVIDNEQKTEVRASRIFGLVRGENNKLGWTEKSKLFGFLKAMGAEDPSALIGKEVTVQLTDLDSNGMRYCTF
jgi:hypothetical protein